MNVFPNRTAAARSALWAALALVGVFAAGCTSSYADLCERGAACRPGSSDLDIDACIIEQEEREEIAAIYGCDAQWNDYIDCMVERGACNGGDRLTGCDAFKDEWKRCVP